MKHTPIAKIKMNPHHPTPFALLCTWATGAALTGAVFVATPAWAEELNLKLDSVGVEAAALPDQPDASGTLRLNAAVSAKGDSGAWSYALGARLDANGQRGAQSFERARLDYTENYLRWQSDSLKITAGTQSILWGRVDEISPIDRLSRVDLTQAMLNRLPERRRAVPAIRVEHFGDSSKLDMVWLPVFDSAVMPDARSVWNPVDTRNGRLLGIGSLPGLAGAQVKDADINGSGGVGLRWTVQGEGVDYGVSLQRARSSQPYYQLQTASGVVLQAVHPLSTVLGGELETQAAGATWRMEVAWSSDNPLTTTGLQYRTASGTAWVLGTEFFPGDAETRVTLQLAGQRINAQEAVLDRTQVTYLTGEIEHPFAQGRWRANLRFSLGLNDRDNYLNPRLTYTGIDQHELFVALHLFGGAGNTLGGFFRRNDALMVGWQAKF
jgi:hypothetical protein